VMKEEVNRAELRGYRSQSKSIRRPQKGLTKDMP
jgi:hypothetical protein